MEIRGQGEVFIDILLIGPSDASKMEENHDIPNEEDFEDNRSRFTTKTVDDAAATDIYGNLETPPIDEDAAELASQIDKPTQNTHNPPPEIAILADARGTVTQQILHPNNAHYLLLHQHHQMKQFQRVDPWHTTNSKQKR